MEIDQRGALEPALAKVRTRPLFLMHLDVKPMAVVGKTSGLFRRVGIVTGGRFEGERMAGKVLDGGADWQSIRSDGSVELDVRLLLQTQDDAVIGMHYRGLRAGSAEVLRRIDAGEVIDPSEYYFRTTPYFETSAEKYGWLNSILAIGIGHRRADGPVYNIFELL